MFYNKPYNKLTGIRNHRLSRNITFKLSSNNRKNIFSFQLNKTLKDFSPEAKTTYLFEKYVEQVRLNRKQEASIKKNDKILHAALKEKELIVQEYNKTLLTK